MEEIGTLGRPFITKYHLDFAIKVVATTISIYADDTVKFQVSPELKGDVAYSESIKPIAAFLYSEGGGCQWRDLYFP